MNRYKVYSVEIVNEDVLTVMKWIDDHADQYEADVWSFHRNMGSVSDVMVPPAYQKAFEGLLKANKIDFSVKFEDLQK